jgi:hypothetical protein
VTAVIRALHTHGALRDGRWAHDRLQAEVFVDDALSVWLPRLPRI